MLRGLRFQKRLRVLPGVRINLSKSGTSTSIGPRSADVNIGRNGVSANAGIPGTGLSYRTKLAKPHSAVIGVVVLVIGLGFAAWKNMDRITGMFAPAPASVSQAAGTAQSPAAVASHAAAPVAKARAAAPKPASIRA